MKQLLITSCAFAFLCIDNANALNALNRIKMQQQQQAQQRVAPVPAQPAPGGVHAAPLAQVNDIAAVQGLPDQNNDITLTQALRQTIIDNAADLQQAQHDLQQAQQNLADARRRLANIIAAKRTFVAAIDDLTAGVADDEF